MRARLIESLAGENILVCPEAADYLLERGDPISFARSALRAMDQAPLFLTLDDLVEFSGTVSTTTRPKDVQPVKVDAHEVHIMMDAKGRTTDVTGNSLCEGKIEDFARYFQDRFTTLRRILQRRRELVGATGIPRAMSRGGDVRVIALVSERRETKNGHIILELEDGEGECKGLIRSDSKLKDLAIVNDEVIGIRGKVRDGGELMYIEEVIRPDVPLTHEFPITDSSNKVAFLSDIHFGSNTFLERPWERMIDWLKRDGVEQGVAYMVLPGDVVDGIGIFPGQDKELLVSDIDDQYRGLAEMLKEIPDGIQVIVHPGNHDAVRPAEPQPAFPDSITEMFDSSVRFVSNPCYLEIEGRSILTYHGRSIDDWVLSVREVTYDDPLVAMREMLTRRHLCPMYGVKTPLAPEQKDYMCIDTVPDIFVTGHVHGAGATMYKGIRMINASTWQGQTEFQKINNFIPDPAKVPLVHLGDGKVTMMHFND